MPTLTLQLAQVALALRGPDAILDGLRQGLAGFVGTSALHHLDVECAPAARGLVTTAPRLSMSARALSLVAQDSYAIELDLTRRQGQLRYFQHDGDRGRGGVPLCLLAALKGLTTTLVLQRGGLLLHAGAVQLDTRAAVFAGVSGAGKSTLTGMFDEPMRLNDELVALDMMSGPPMVYGTPFSGTLERPLQHRQAPWGVGYALVQDASAAVRPLSKAAALKHVLRCVPVPDGDHDLHDRAFAAATALAQLPWRVLHFPLEPEAALAAVAQGLREPS